MNRTFGNIAICFALVLLPLFSTYSHASDSNTNEGITILDKELYDPELFVQLQSVDDLVTYIQKDFKGEKNSNEFVNYMSRLISRRFYHGYCYYSSKDNWIGNFIAKLTWNDLSAIVVPDDILKHPNAACSQQSIVLMACAKKFGLNYRKVSFAHHFAMEIEVNKKWHYVDPNMEVIPPKGSVEELMSEGKFFAFYSNRIPLENMKDFFGQPVYGPGNKYPALKTAIFQKTTYFLSQYLIFFVFALEFFLFLKWYNKDSLSRLS